MMMVMTLDTLVSALFAIFICVLTNYVGSVSCLGSGIFLPTGVESKVKFLRLTCLYQHESTPKVAGLSKWFGAQISYVISKFETQFYSYSRSQTLPHSLKPL